MAIFPRLPAPAAPTPAPAPAPPGRRLKPLAAVPRAVVPVLALALALQLGWQASRQTSWSGIPVRLASRTPATTPAPAMPRLPPAPSQAALQLAALGEPVALARLTMLYVQGFDEQPGASIAWRTLDYDVLAAWLERVLALDPRGQSPLLAASTVYGAVSDPARARTMLALVHAHFAEDPQRRWPWLAQAALMARHRLHDLPLAQRYARDIRLHATGPTVPAWARQMEIFILEDMNEYDSASALIGGLLASGQVTDPNELRLLSSRLQQLEQLQQLKQQKRAPPP